MKNYTTIEKMNFVVKNLTSSGYKMGDKFTLTVGEITVIHDTREYYQGRGAKYNKNINHGYISVEMTEKELNKAFKPILLHIKEKAKRLKADALHLKNCNKPSFLTEKAKEALILNPNSHLKGYFGCGVYRLIIQNGKIVATLYGGIYNSKPYKSDVEKWFKALNDYAIEVFGNNYVWVKADGSGTQFFLRDEDDAQYLQTKQYIVPAPNGDGNLGFSNLNTQII